MAPNYADRQYNAESRMTLRTEQSDIQQETGNTGIFARREPAFIIGNKAFFLAIKRALDISGGFHIVGAFRMEDLATSIHRSTLLGQTPRVAVIHEPHGERAVADDAAHEVLQNYPGCGIVLISGDELEAESERKMAVHDFNAVVMPESVIKNPHTLAKGMHNAITAAGDAQRIA